MDFHSSPPLLSLTLFEFKKVPLLPWTYDASCKLLHFYNFILHKTINKYPMLNINIFTTESTKRSRCIISKWPPTLWELVNFHPFNPPPNCLSPRSYILLVRPWRQSLFHRRAIESYHVQKQKLILCRSKVLFLMRFKSLFQSGQNIELKNPAILGGRH